MSAFWRSHALWPLAAYVAAMGLLAGMHFDLVLANRWFFDAASGGWIGRGSFWAVDLVHAGGGYLVRAIGLAAFAGWLASWKVARLAPWRRALGYFLLAVVLANAITGVLKQLTNIDCPWDLEPFGGRFPYVGLFADRPDALRHAACFPGAHSASGFALVALYFVLRDAARERAWIGLAIGLGFGAVFAFAQEARGAHFLSHDLTSAAIAWFTSLALYAFFQSFSTTLPALRPASWYSTASAADSSPTKGVGSTSARNSPR
jgi:membrane-associated PAP2 superfamily phosphatase